MEVQSPQSVQINFNNKIITLHNVKIVKNPKIITIDATQYSNFLKGSPVKLSNGTTATTSPVKLQLPTLVSTKTIVASPPNAAFKTSSIVLNRTPVITMAPALTTNQVVQSMQHSKNFVHFKPSIKVVSAAAASKSPVKLQAFPVSHQQTVIISPPKTSSSFSRPVTSQPKVEFKQAPTISSSKTLIPPTTPVNNKDATLPKVVTSQSQKNKTSPCTITPPAAKRQRQKLEFNCIFCEDIYDDSDFLVEHMKLKHPEKVKLPVEKSVELQIKAEIKELPVVGKPKNEATIPAIAEVSAKLESEFEAENEVRDLLMDLDDTQDTAMSAQTRSDTPESPEFEEHVPVAAVKEEEPKRTSQDQGESCSEDFDYENFEHFSRMLEPICELSCEDDSNDGVQDENEAMRLYREAMEVNYQQNGIKKRGRRKQRKPKPLSNQLENTTSLNGILAGLLENSFLKVPPGPGRGRRKEINEQELELDRSNGVCLFSCNKCDETFKYAGDLAKHVRSHTISSPYQCSICQRKFTHIGSLNTHLRIHSGERPYKVNLTFLSYLLLFNAILF